MPPQEITAQASKAVQLDPADARAHMVAATAYFFNKQLDLFEREAQQAMALAPYDAEILATLGYLIASSGQWQRGVALAQKANALNADAAAGGIMRRMYLNYYLNGDYNARWSSSGSTPINMRRFTPTSTTSLSMAARSQGGSARKLAQVLGEDPSWTAESFVNGTIPGTCVMRTSAKLMDGIYKSGVLDAAAKTGQ